ncbi:MAG: hypothetical protein KGI50_00920 [Patescibacteria group bacterium]|nr:hypothetical protein [Patescibacteria group bacterium]MDE2438085.1 hypothetical protein [Patescibacteria group bacterium]
MSDLYRKVDPQTQFFLEEKINAGINIACEGFVVVFQERLAEFHGWLRQNELCIDSEIQGICTFHNWSISDILGILREDPPCLQRVELDKGFISDAMNQD